MRRKSKIILIVSIFFILLLSSNLFAQSGFLDGIRKIFMKDGIHTTYYQSGTLHFERSFQDGKLNGLCKEYYEIGNLKQEYHFKDNKAHGPAAQYREDGSLMITSNFVKGIQNGKLKRYYKNGKVEVKGNMLNGKLEGEARAYDKKGRLTHIMMYKNGKEISRKKFDVKSNIIVKKPASRKQGNLFVHKSGAFRIKPPKGYEDTILQDDGVGFYDYINASFIKIDFSEARKGFTDKQLLERFNNENFLKDFIKAFEKGSGMVVSKNRPGKLNGIPAWEFTSWTRLNKEILWGRTIIIYSNGKEFSIQYVIPKKYFNDRLKIISEALKTFKVLK